jgi:hypothetical protein
MLRLLIRILPLVAVCAGVVCAQNPAAPTPFPCAAEGARCSFTGTGMAYYGAGSTWHARVATDGADCTTAVFGDPFPGIPKHCLTSLVPGAPCAAEGGSCAVSGAALMLYGANGVYTGKVVTQATACSISVFEDPAPNVPKACVLVNVPAEGNAPAAVPAVRRAPPRPPQVTRVTYATLELPAGNNPVSGYVAANADGSLALNGNEFMAVYFAISGSNSPPSSGDMVRLGDSGGRLALTNRSDGNLRMQPAAIAGGAQYHVRRMDSITGPMTDWALFALQAQPDGRLIKFDNGAMKLFTVPVGGSSIAYSVLRLHIHTLAQLNELQAQRSANENTAAQPQIRRGN